MNRLILTFSLLMLASFKFLINKDVAFIKENFLFANKQLKNMLSVAGATPLGFPRTTGKDGKLVTTDMYEWTSGFFPGSLWYAYEATGDQSIKADAIKWTEKLEPVKDFTKQHDIGFMMYCSYGNAYRLTGNEKYKDILIRSAHSLTTRFSPVTGCIKSWNGFTSWHGGKPYNFPVIIDNMMNLELLFFASEATGDTTFRHIAISHALHTMKNQIRDDYSSYHVVCYNDVTGEVVTRETAQGYADNSTWSRGQGWGIYGFTMCYRNTKDERFLKTAQGMADWYLDNKNLPDDKIPYWDFNARQSGYIPAVNSHALQTKYIPRDASAGAIVASALLELSTYTSGKKSEKYKQAAITMLHSLGSPAYRAQLGANGDFMLEHCTGSVAHGSEIDVPLVYADYYFLEALNRYNNLLNNKDVLTGKLKS